MKIWQIKEISPDTYKSLSDDLKIKMVNQQFAFPVEHYDEVREWLIENMKNPYTIDQLKNTAKQEHVWIKFVDEADATAFKLRWS